MLLSIGVVYGQTNLNSYNAQKEMTQEMQVIVNDLKLEPVEIVEVGKIMEARRDRKAVIADQIKSLLEQLNAIDQATEEQIKATFTPEQLSKYEEIVRPKLTEMRGLQK
jgi:hypothetical protein